MASATDCTFSAASVDADSTLPDRSRVAPAVAVMASAAASSSVDDEETERTTLATAVSNAPASACMSVCRASAMRRAVSFSAISNCSMRMSFSLKVCAAARGIADLVVPPGIGNGDVLVAGREQRS